MKKLDGNAQSLILPLLGSCFPDYWEQLALARGRMPFYEISFAEFDGEKVIGHCGIIPYRIWCGNEIFPMAGIASVAVDPAYRNRGIARALCDFAAEWAEENGFVSLPLYTAHFRVYESCRWRRLDVPGTLSLKDAPPSATVWKPGSVLTPAEKSTVIRLYENAGIFDGKVIRDDQGTLHSWERIFAEPEFTFAVIPGGYGIKSGGVIVEANFSPETSGDDIAGLFGTQPFYLPETPVQLADLPVITSTADAMHGERPMVRDAGTPEFHRMHQIFFPVTDKF